ncbi:MAG: hypothetical protein ACOYL6_16675 [Bacteriovoracaceae bacterium]
MKNLIMLVLGMMNALAWSATTELTLSSPVRKAMIVNPDQSVTVELTEYKTDGSFNDQNARVLLRIKKTEEIDALIRDLQSDKESINNYQLLKP